MPGLSRYQFVNGAFAGVKAFHDHIDTDFNKLLFHLQEISKELETRRFNFRAIRKFKTRAAVQQAARDAEGLVKEIQERGDLLTLVQEAVQEAGRGQNSQTKEKGDSKAAP